MGCDQQFQAEQTAFSHLNWSRDLLACFVKHKHLEHADKFRGRSLFPFPSHTGEITLGFWARSDSAHNSEPCWFHVYFVGIQEATKLVSYFFLTIVLHECLLIIFYYSCNILSISLHVLNIIVNLIFLNYFLWFYIIKASRLAWICQLLKTLLGRASQLPSAGCGTNLLLQLLRCYWCPWNSTGQHRLSQISNSWLGKPIHVANTRFNLLLGHQAYGNGQEKSPWRMIRSHYFI